MFDNKIYVYNKNMELLATFSGDTEGVSEESMMNMMVAPTVHIEQNGISTFSFQMLPFSEKWNQIKDPENIYRVNDRFYTALNDGAYAQVDNNGVRVMNVTLTERWSLLSKQYNQAYNCGIYTYAKAKFVEYVNDGAKFTINANDCLNPGETISTQKAWEQVKAWEPKDADGNQLSFAILTSDEFKPVNWKEAPSGVFFKSFEVSENTATVIIEPRARMTVNQVYQYDAGTATYNLDVKPLPSKIEKVRINYTIVSEGSYTTDEKDIASYTYNASTGLVSLSYTPSANEQVNAVIISYQQTDLGEISAGATCTFAFGAEAVDEHTFVILPKANTKYNLTIDGVSYDDSEVKDSRGVVMPRGSGGYAMWAALKNSGWSLGICDVIATDFDPSIDYGVFNIESDMKDVLYNVEYIQQLYGGILNWDSEHKMLHYRAENSTDYQAFDDGFNQWTGYEFREGKNMTERPEIIYDNSIITRAYLLGYGNLNVKKVNNGKTYIDDFSYTDAIYEGYLEQPLIYDTRDEGGQKQLLYWGQKELKKRCRPRRNIKLSVTDIRTVEGMEHEVFNINDVVRVHYHDELTGENVVEEKRVILWEYNVFAMWDCTVELGETTSNLTELFKLIYNKSLKSPDVNNSGNISSNNIHMGGIGWGGNGDSYWGSGDSDSLTRYMEYIAQTSTKNSDAIAGLILDTSTTHSQVDLFALYQKQTDNLFTQTYAGLQLYADEKKAEAILDANHYSEKLTEELDGTLTEKIVETDAQLRLYADERGSAAELVATGYYNVLKNDISQLEIQTAAGFKAEQDARGALAQQFAAYQTTVNGQISQSQSYVLSQVAQNYATNQMVAQVSQNVASLQTTVNNLGSTISAQVKNDFAHGGLSVSVYGNTSNVTINAETCQITSADIYLGGVVRVSASIEVNQGQLRINGRGLYNGTASVKDSSGNTITLNYVTWQ